VSDLSADNDALAAGWAWDEIIIGGRAARLLIGVTAAGSAAVELDAVTSSGDAVALTRAGRASGVVGHGRGLGDGRAGAGAEGRANGGWWAELVVGVVIEGGRGEAAGQVTDGGGIKGAVFGLEDGLGGVWGDGLW